MDRRHLLKAGFLTLVPITPIRAHSLSLAVNYAPTGEFWRGTWRDRDGGASAAAQLSGLCRDHINGTAHATDPKLWDILAAVARDTGRSEWQILSGYRSPRTNAALGGVPRSLHSAGRAIDVRIPPNEINDFVNSAKRAGAGGIGIYRARGFVHLDTREVPYSWG